MTDLEKKEAMHHLGSMLDAMDYGKLSSRQWYVVLFYWIGIETLEGFIWKRADWLLDLREAFEAIGATRGTRLLDDLFKFFPGNTPPADRDECNEAMRPYLDQIRTLFESLDKEFEMDLFVRLYEFWRDGTPMVEVDLSKVQTAAELLSAVSEGLALSGCYGNNLDKFARDLGESVNLPRGLTLRGWDRVAKQMPRDSDLLIEYFREQGPEIPLDLYLK